jgi:hypothetical protein
MAMTVKVVTSDEEYPVRWPNCCAQCGSKKDLTLVRTKVYDTRLVKPWMLLLGRIHTRTHTLEMGYPVCKDHASGWQSLARWITQNSGLPRTLRWVAYFFASTMLIAAAVAVQAMLHKSGVKTGGSGTSPPFNWSSMLSSITIMLLPIVSVALVARAYRIVPLRLTRLEDDAVTIRFNVNRFARAFERANPNTLV